MLHSAVIYKRKTCSHITTSNKHISTISERHGLNDPKRVELLKQRITSLLKDKLNYSNAIGGGGRVKPSGENSEFSQILDLRQSLRSLNVQGLQRIFYLKLEDVVPAPPLIEKMFASSIPF